MRFEISNYLGEDMSPLSQNTQIFHSFRGEKETEGLFGYNLSF